ncbi:hypothetical protein, partial [Staphylococcus aureus]|uniref:hypothetical protein n=1 Tax=Staphylococcus aureus TaxID=1280 RepID=UPI0021485D26
KQRFFKLFLGEGGKPPKKKATPMGRLQAGQENLLGVRSARACRLLRGSGAVVAAPFLAAAERSLLERFEAALCACLDNDDFDAAEWPSFFSVRVVVLLRL